MPLRSQGYDLWLIDLALRLGDTQGRHVSLRQLRGYMRELGSILAVVGGVFAVWALNMDVSVPSGPYGFGRVNNMGLMADRQNYLMLSIGAIIAGVVLYALGKGKIEVSTDTNITETKAPSQKTVEFYDRERNIEEGSYKLYLVNKYNIQKNETLGQFVVGETLFDSLEKALGFAHDADSEAQNNFQRAKERIEEDRTLRGTLGPNGLARYQINPDHTATVRIGDWSKTYPNLDAAIAGHGPVNN